MKLKEFDIAEHLSNENEMLMYLREIIDDGDAELVAYALSDIARARHLLHEAFLKLSQVAM